LIDPITQESKIKKQYLFMVKDLKSILDPTNVHAPRRANKKVLNEVLENRKNPSINVIMLPV
jgi:hypothetical protein